MAEISLAIVISIFVHCMATCCVPVVNKLVTFVLYLHSFMLQYDVY